jgi:hypothetical protein
MFRGWIEAYRRSGTTDRRNVSIFRRSVETCLRSMTADRRNASNLRRSVEAYRRSMSTDRRNVSTFRRSAQISGGQRPRTETMPGSSEGQSRLAAGG